MLALIKAALLSCLSTCVKIIDYVIFVQMTNASEAATKEEFVLQFSMSVSAQKDFTKKEINV